MKNILTKRLKLNGVTPIMFDAFRGQEETPVEKKFYLARDGETLIFPNSNILGFLNSQKVHSCLRIFWSNKEWQIRSNEIKGCVAITPSEVVFKDGNKPIKFKDWNDKISIDTRMAFPSKTARVMAIRPVLSLPWSLEFDVSINPTEFITEERIIDWFMRGGFQVGFGANRPLFGRFDTEVLS